MRSLQSSTGESWIVLGEHGEQDWSRLRQQIQLAEGFWLGFLFTAASPVANLFRGRAKDLYRSRARLLQRIRPATPAELAQLTGQLFAASDPAPACLWIEALDVGQVEGQGLTWEEGWRHFLVRLNERRERARRTFHGLMLVAPPPLKIIAREIASDLWSVRSLVLEPPLPRPLKPVVERSLEEPRTPTSSRTTIQPTPTVEATPEQALDWMREAEGLLLAEKPEEARVVALRAVGALQQAEDERLPASSFPQALALLARAEVADGDPWAAKEHFKQAALVATELTSDRTPLPWLSEWYSRAIELGDFAEAEQAAEEQLNLARSLVDSSEAHYQELSDLSVSLDTLGDIREHQGRLDEANSLFQENLLLIRQIRVLVGDSPQVLGDLSIALQRLGDIRVQQGDLPAASSLFEEGLTTARQTQEIFGDSPQTLRNLASTLDRLGNIQAQQGSLHRAAHLFEESREIATYLRSTLGDSLEPLRDLCVSLWKQAHLALKTQDHFRARALLDECAELRRRLVNLRGEQPELQEMLDVAEAKLGNITQETDSRATKD